MLCILLKMNIKIEKLIKQFSKLPRLGGRAAQRIVLALLQDKTGKAIALADALKSVSESIVACENCGVLTDKSHQSPICEYCCDMGRENGQLSIVRDLSDVWTLEKSGVFGGRYHVIGGLLSGSVGITPQDLNISNLQMRIKKEKVTEIIFALPNTIEGKTTQHYIINSLHITDFVLKFSELASGVPLGGDLDYIDDGTLTLAFGDRKKI